MTTTENTTVFSQAVMLEYERRVRSGEKDVEIFTPEGRGAFVASEEELVTTIDDLLELVSVIGDNWAEECTYTGKDHLSVDVYRAKLPDNYCARVCYIQMQHIPEPHFRRGEVLPQVDKTGQLYMAAPRIMPVWTSRSMVSYFGGKRFETSEQVITDNYHYLTFKIRKDGSLKSWAPGVDKDTGLCKTLSQQYVFVGV